MICCIFSRILILTLIFALFILQFSICEHLLAVSECDTPIFMESLKSEPLLCSESLVLVMVVEQSKQFVVSQTAFILSFAPGAVRFMDESTLLNLFL